jgi:iron complex outermembrane recepter protein
MKKILTILTVLISVVSFAQTSGKVTGVVEDGSQKIIEAATISLQRVKDSSIAKVTAADKTGRYNFENVKDGIYFVSISAVGHQKGFTETFTINSDKPSVELKTITLIPSDKAMSGVTVAARKPLIEQRIDRTIVNVDASITNVGTTALEVLEKSPGISVDKDGNISLKGKQGVMVFVDGRPTQLGAADLANYLRNLNSSQLDQIEIMTNPPAKYDAAGNAGIINIKTKKNRQMGYNGTLTLGYGQGRLPKFNEALNFNYKEGKVNLFANLSHNYRRHFQDLDIKRNFRDKTSKELVSSFDQEARMKRESNSYSGKIGLDYFANKTTSFGVVFGGFTSPRVGENRNFNLMYDPSGELNKQTRAFSGDEQTFKNFNSNFNFRKLLDTAGKELTADLDYVIYDGKNEQFLTNSYFDAAGAQTQKADSLYGNLPQNIKIYSGKVDYLQPMRKGARFEAGLKTSFVRTDNNAIYDTTDNGVLVRDMNRSNHFVYEENINAAYVNLSGPLGKKWSGQLGLRVENTIAKGRQLTTGENFDRNYTQLFPTAFLQYKASDKNSFVLNYGRRIRRPDYQSLNPFIQYLDRYTYQQGNPNLKPQFSHNVELSHTFKNFLTTTLNFTQTNDIINQVFEQDEAKNETYVKQANIAKQRQYGIAISANTPITKWWTSNIYVNAFQNHYEGIVNGEFVSKDAKTVALNGSQQFKVSKTLTAEISGFFRTAGLESVMLAKSFGSMSFGLSQQVLSGKGTLRLGIRDILYSQQFRGVMKYGSVDASFKEQSDSRVVNIGFTYRFSKGKINGTQKRRTGSASDEQNRVGGGN